jgi:hypothetical protein
MTSEYEVGRHETQLKLDAGSVIPSFSPCIAHLLAQTPFHFRAILGEKSFYHLFIRESLDKYR